MEIPEVLIRWFVSVSILFAATSAAATPITYLYSGTGSGMLGEQGFSEASFTITALADTDGISDWFTNVIRNPHLSATITISGLGAHVLISPSHTWHTPGGGGLGADEGPNWITLDEQQPAAWFSYGLDTALSPVVDASPLDFVQFRDVSTSGGALSFSNMGTVTFTAVVPEPGAIALVGPVPALLALLRRRVMTG